MRFNNLYTKCVCICRHKMFVISLKLLREHNITFKRIIQHPNEFILTFPFGYHFGFSFGSNCSEAVNCIGDPVKQLQFSKHATKDSCDTNLNTLSLVKLAKKYNTPSVYKEYVQGKSKKNYLPLLLFPCLFGFFEKFLLYVVNHCTTINHKNFNEICFFFGFTV